MKINVFLYGYEKIIQVYGKSYSFTLDAVQRLEICAFLLNIIVVILQINHGTLCSCWGVPLKSVIPIIYLLKMYLIIIDKKDNINNKKEEFKETKSIELNLDAGDYQDTEQKPFISELTDEEDM